MSRRAKSNEGVQPDLRPWCRRCKNTKLVDGPIRRQFDIDYPTLMQCPDCAGGKKPEAPRSYGLDGPSRAAGEKED